VMREWPAHDAFVLFLAARPDILAEFGQMSWTGELSGGPDNLAVSSADEPPTSLFLCYGPTEPDEDVLEDYGKFVPEMASIMLVAVPFGHGTDAHELAFVFSEWLATSTAELSSIRGGASSSGRTTDRSWVVIRALRAATRAADFGRCARSRIRR
jgi:hypothetical protein